MKQLIYVSALLISSLPFLNFNPDPPTSKTFKATYVENIASVGAVVEFEAAAPPDKYYRFTCPNVPTAWGCAITAGSIPCSAPASCPVQSAFRLVPCPGEPNVTHCAAATSGTSCPNPTACSDQLSYQPCPLSPGELMCANGGTGTVCSTPQSCPPPVLAPAQDF